VVFRSDRRGNSDLYIQNSSGTEPELLLVAPTIISVPTDWSSDGRFIVYHTVGEKTGYDLWVLDMGGGRKAWPFLHTTFNETQGHLSPDGRWMAYTSDESGTLEVWVRPFPAGDDKWLLSTSGGSEPRWRRDSKELFYLAANRQLMAVPITDGSKFKAGEPKALFETRVGPINPEFRDQYAAFADGSRFLVNTVSEGSSSSPITVVLNWTEALRRRSD
jgi:Tol biopolymer transport system component